jgi:phage gp16-like protein
MSQIGLQKAARMSKIHALCGRKNLNLPDDERRALQVQLTGKTSTKDMTVSELGAVIDHLNKLGQPASLVEKPRKSGNEWSFVFKLPADRQVLAKKLYRLAERIGAMQSPPLPIVSPAYMSGTARQMMGYGKPEFANVVVRVELSEAAILHKMVQAMESHLKRHGG